MKKKKFGAHVAAKHTNTGRASGVSNLTLNDESGCCIVLLGQARWIELMSDEKNYNRHTIGLWAIQEKQAHWRSLLDLTPTGGRFEAFLGKKSGSNSSPTDTYLNEKSWRGGLTQDGQWGNSKNLLANPIFLFNFSRVIKTTPHIFG